MRYLNGFFKCYIVLRVTFVSWQCRYSSRIVLVFVSISFSVSSLAVGETGLQLFLLSTIRSLLFSKLVSNLSQLYMSSSDSLSSKKYHNGHSTEIGKNAYKIKINSVYMYAFKGKCVNKSNDEPVCSGSKK